MEIKWFWNGVPCNDGLIATEKITRVIFSDWRTRGLNDNWFRNDMIPRFSHEKKISEWRNFSKSGIDWRKFGEINFHDGMKVKSGKNVLVTHPSTNDTELIMVTKVSPAIIFSGRFK